jgi:two-component system cell cycle response regulator DivK
MTTALVIEDNEDNMELISFILESNGYQIIKAWTGEEGVSLTLEKQPDFIILDIQLPDIDGYEVLHRIRGTTAGGDIPVIAMTSYAMAGDREKMLAAGCNGYIEKPIDPERVIEQIRRMIAEQG